jgi:hypothetical protein
MFHAQWERCDSCNDCYDVLLYLARFWNVEPCACHRVTPCCPTLLSLPPIVPPWQVENHVKETRSSSTPRRPMIELDNFFVSREVAFLFFGWFGRSIRFLFPRCHPPETRAAWCWPAAIFPRSMVTTFVRKFARAAAMDLTTRRSKSIVPVVIQTHLHFAESPWVA